MKRSVMLVLAAVSALVLSLLTVDFRAAYTSDQVNSHQGIASAKAGPGAPIGRRLTVHLAGEQSLAGDIEAQLAGALQAKELLFDEVSFVDEMPADAYANPVLVIYAENSGGFWTPFYAATHLKATLLFAIGRPIDPAQVLVIDPEGFTHGPEDATCKGLCSTGHRTVDLTGRTVGLVSLPHVRSYAAGKLVDEAVALVAGGLPDHLNPARWSDRAGELAREKLPIKEGGFSSFRRKEGCRGGLVVAGGLGENAELGVMYYDADRDAITGVVTRSELEAKAPDIARMGSPSTGFSDDGLSLYLGPSSRFSIPSGSCSLSGWQIDTDSAR